MEVGAGFRISGGQGVGKPIQTTLDEDELELVDAARLPHEIPSVT